MEDLLLDKYNQLILNLHLTISPVLSTECAPIRTFLPKHHPNLKCTFSPVLNTIHPVAYAEIWELCLAPSYLLPPKPKSCIFRLLTTSHKSSLLKIANSTGQGQASHPPKGFLTLLLHSHLFFYNLLSTQQPGYGIKISN